MFSVKVSMWKCLPSYYQSSNCTLFLIILLTNLHRTGVAKEMLDISGRADLSSIVWTEKEKGKWCITSYLRKTKSKGKSFVMVLIKITTKILDMNWVILPAPGTADRLEQFICKMFVMVLTSIITNLMKGGKTFSCSPMSQIWHVLELQKMIGVNMHLQCAILRI